MKTAVPITNSASGIETKIYEIRGKKVMLDFDLAELYGTETKRLKEAVRRKIKRFPPDFMFELTRDEYHSLRSQIASLENGRGKKDKQAIDQNNRKRIGYK